MLISSEDLKGRAENGDIPDPIQAWLGVGMSPLALLTYD